MKKYSILKYNIDNYDPHPEEIENPSEICEYVYVTDDKNFSSYTWKVIYVENPFPEDPFFLCYYIRFHPFEYVSTEVVIRIDCAMRIPDPKKVDSLYSNFIESDCDICASIHYIVDNYTYMMNTYKWLGRTDDEEIRNLTQYFIDNGYPPTYRGMIAMTCMIMKDSYTTDIFNSRMFRVLRELKLPNKKIQRDDQIPATYVLNKYMRGCPWIKFMDWSIWNRDYFLWYDHQGNYVNHYYDMYIPKVFWNRELTSEDFIKGLS